MQEENKIISAAIDTLTGKLLFTLKIPVRWKPKRKWWQLFKNKNDETVRVYEIWPCVVANQFRIAGKALTLPAEIFDDANLLFPIFEQHQKTMVYIIASAIQNNHLEPDKKLIEFLTNNLPGEDIFNVLQASLQSVNMQSFFDSIVLMNGLVKIVSQSQKSSPLDGSELIASHTQELQAHVNTLDGQSGM
ncbi:MAG: hypothetical protein EOO42_01250 [Flavobacteriales bacterium]|nr:MAG: hypothetical protein EOO42_01250 [Flavobacteriales bacterium]